MTRPAISIVMPFAGSRADAERALEALTGLDTAPGDELILADNSGVAPERDGVRVVLAAAEHSPSHARNVGAEHAVGEWVLFLDSDCRPESRLIEHYFADPIAADVGALAGEVIASADGVSLASRYGASRSFLRQSAHLAHPYLPRAVAANLLVRRAAFEQVGGFFEGVRAAEDTDFSWRLQRAGWRLDARPRARVQHEYRTSVEALRRQWRGYAAGRAWLGRRYVDFKPEPALRRAGTRLMRRDRTVAPPRSRPLPATTVRRRDRGRFLALDALLGVEELAGLALSNRPRRGDRGPVRVVLVAERFPARGDPLTDFARTVAGARVEAVARPEAFDQRVARELSVDYLEDDGSASRLLALVRLVCRHPLRCALDAVRRQPRRRQARGASAGRAAIGAGPGGARPRARRRRGPCHRQATRRTGRARARRAMTRVDVVDPSAFTPPYDHALSAALARAGADVTLVTSRFAYGDAPAQAGYRISERFYRFARGAPGSRLRRVTKALEHVPDMLAYRRTTADVVHFQWLPMQWLDGFLLPRGRPVVLTAHDLLPREARPGQARAQRRLYDRVDAIVVHSRYGRSQLVDRLRVDTARVHVIPHGAFDYLASLPDAPLPGGMAEVEGPVVLFFGLIRPYKGVEVLLEAWRGIEGAELWIVGRPLGVDISELAELAGPNVRFVSRFVPDGELPAYFRRADVVVLPYTRTERLDFSGVLATALAFGRATVVSDVGGLGEVEAVKVVPPDDADTLRDALRSLINDQVAREQLAAAALAAARGPYSWDAAATQTLALYEQLLRR